MSLFSSLSAWFTKAEVTTQADIIAIVAAIKKGEAVLLADLTKVNNWVISNGPAIAAGIDSTISIAAQVTALVNPGAAAVADLAAAAADAAKVASSLNAYVAGAQTATPTVASVLAGVTAVEQANAAHSQAIVALAAVPKAA